MSPRLKVGDFGCGEAKLMEEIGHDRVISFDHVAINDKAIACDMKSVSQYLNDEGLDVVVFSLMGIQLEKKCSSEDFTTMSNDSKFIP
jgi:putative methyltransferase